MTDHSKCFKCDNTRCDDYDRCPRYDYFRHICNLVNTNDVAALRFGSALHVVGDCLFQGKSLAEAKIAFEKAYPIDLDEKRTVRVGKTITEDYYKEYANQPLKNVVSIEKMRHILIPTPHGPDIDYYGKIDKIIEMAGFGVMVLDHKSTSYFVTEFQKMVKRHHQFTGYIAIVMQEYPDLYGLFVDIMHVPPAYKRVTTEIKTQFSRPPTTRTDFEIEEWMKYVRFIVQDIERSMNDDNWPQKTAGCYKYRKYCPYADLCNLPTDHHAQAEYALTLDNFEIESWEPWNTVEEDE